MSNNSKKNVVSKKDDKVVSIKEVQNSIIGMEKKLEEQIENFQKKAQLIRDRKQFIRTRERILEYIKEEEADFDPSLDSKRLALRLVDNRSYRDENIISISNNAVIRDMMGILLTRINQKIAEIEENILH